MMKQLQRANIRLQLKNNFFKVYVIVNVHLIVYFKMKNLYYTYICFAMILVLKNHKISENNCSLHIIQTWQTFSVNQMSET